MLLQNEFPAESTKQMWLIAPFRHITEMSALDSYDWRHIGHLMEWCLKEQNINGGGIIWRFGDPHFNAGTIAHLHINIIEPTPGVEYRAPFAKNEPDHEKNYRRMLGFRDELITKGGSEWLFSDEGIRETQP